MESCFPKAVEKLVAGAITELGNQPAWWYSIDGEKDDLSSMANLFEVDNTLLHQMLSACGLYYPKSGIVTCRRFNRNGFDNFINRYNLDIEVDKHCKAFFVRIGSYTSPKGKVSVKCQKKEDVPKPRLSSKL